MNSKPKGFGLFPTAIIFTIAALVLFLETHFLIPYLSKVTGPEPVIFWFAVAVLGMFLPLLIVAYVILRSEGQEFNKSTWKDRLRFRKMTRHDRLRSLAGIVLIGIISYPVMSLIETFTEFDRHPPRSCHLIR